MWFRNIFSRINERITLSSPEHSIGQEINLSSAALRQLDRLSINASRYLPGHYTGLRNSFRRKLSADFLEHRSYVPGDDIRFVDWKASARQEHMYVKQGQQPKEVTVYLLLDCSASMAWGNPPKSSTLISVATALSYLALTHSDRLFIYPMNKQTPFGPVSGKGQFPNLLKYLRTLKFSDAIEDPSEQVRIFSRSLAKTGGFTVILSDYLDWPDLSSVLKYLPAPTWDVLLLHFLHREELDPSVRGNFEVKDVETGAANNYDLNAEAINIYKQRLADWIKGLEAVCLEKNAFYSLIPTDWSLEREILSHLREIEIVKPL